MDNGKLNVLGSLASILGLFLTILIAIIGYLIKNKIKEINRAIQFNARIKSLLKNLNVARQNYVNHLEDYINSHQQIRYELSQIEVILYDIKRKITYREKKPINKLLNQIKLMKFGHFIDEQNRKKGIWITIIHLFVKSQEISSYDLWQFYTNISATQTHLENLIADKKITNYG